MAKYIIAPSGLTDLDEIWHYLAESNEEAADKLLRTLGNNFQLLAENKKIGKRQDDFIVEMRMFPFKNYNIYYFPTENGIEIYRIIHGRRDAEEMFEDYFEGLKG